MFDDLDVQCTVLLNCPGLTLSELGTRFIYGFWPVLLHSIFWPVLLRSIFWPVLLRSIFWVFGAPPPHHRNHFPRHDVCATALLCHLFGLLNMARSRTKGKILHVQGTYEYMRNIFLCSNKKYKKIALWRLTSLRKRRPCMSSRFFDFADKHFLYEELL